MMRDTALLFGDRLHRDVQLMVDLGCWVKSLVPDGTRLVIVIAD
jgi:hypothetical protein